MEPFGTRLRQSMDDRGPLCVGIDPHIGLLHSWGIDDNPAGLATYESAGGTRDPGDPVMFTWRLAEGRHS